MTARHSSAWSRSASPLLRHGSRGFSLIELMVGIVIGMIAVIVIAQVFRLNEGFRRTTTGLDDANNNGAVALVGLQHEVRQAGFGLSAFVLSGCNLTAQPAGAWPVNGLSPVTINHPDVPEGDPNTDTLLVMYGNSNSSPEGDRVVSQPATAQYAVAAQASFRAGDQVIALPNPTPATCNLRLEVSAPVAATNNVAVTVGLAGMTNGTLFNLGPQPRFLAYAVRNGSLTQCDFALNDCRAGVDDETIWTPIANNIVSLRAEYGRDTTAPNMDAIVDVFDQNAPADACQRARISAVRLVLVARSGQFEQVPPDVGMPRWAGSAETADHLVAVPIDLSDNADWQRFRYRSFETTIPLRNMAWQGVQTGC